jgi:hypothetical protein
MFESIGWTLLPDHSCGKAIIFLTCLLLVKLGSALSDCDIEYATSLL